MTEEEYNKLVEEVGRSEANRQRRAAARKAKRDTRGAKRKARGDYNEITSGSRIRSNGEDLNNPLANDLFKDRMQEMYRLQREADEARYRQSNIKPDFGSNGLDYLKKNYDPAKNPYDPKNPNYVSPQAKAASAVAELRELQRHRAEQRQMDLERYRRTIDGDTTRYYSNPLDTSDGPDFTAINIPEQYGGGTALGSSEPLIRIDPNRKLPTGSGIPMSALQAFATDKLENNIYAPVDRSNPVSMDANDARRFAVQDSIKERVRDFYENPRTTEEEDRYEEMIPPPDPSMTDAPSSLPEIFDPYLDIVPEEVLLEIQALGMKGELPIPMGVAPGISLGGRAIGASIRNLYDDYILGNKAPSYMDAVRDDAIQEMLKQELARRGYYID